MSNDIAKPQDAAGGVAGQKAEYSAYNEIRALMKTLDKSKQYITYCQTGRRRSAAAFILAQNEFHVFVLDGGTRSVHLPIKPSVSALSSRHTQ